MIEFLKLVFLKRIKIIFDCRKIWKNIFTNDDSSWFIIEASFQAFGIDMHALIFNLSSFFLNPILKLKSWMLENIGFPVQKLCILFI